MDALRLLVPVLALIVSLASFVVAWMADARSRNAEDVRNLLGEKESVAFGALKLMRDGLPTHPKDRKLLMLALMQACVFEGSDRARALLYRVIQKNRTSYQSELDQALRDVEETFGSMERYEFREDELDLSRGQRRVAAVRKVLATAAIP